MRFILRWTTNEWQDIRDTPSTATSIGIEFVDIPVRQNQQAPVRFTFYCVDVDQWQGEDFQITVRQWEK